jgi:replicative DNA helicase
MPILAVVATFVAYYFKTKQAIIAAANGAINSAEDTEKAGKEKFEQAVNDIVALIPAVLKPFISRELVEVIVQKAFDEIDEFAEKQANKTKEDK